MRGLLGAAGPGRDSGPAAPVPRGSSGPSTSALGRMNPARMLTCIGCGGRFADLDGPVHEYMESSPGCWAAFGNVLARECEDRSLFPVHRLSVDAYAVQHPGGSSRKAIQSVGMHLSRLCMVFERGLSPEDANAAMLRVGRNKATIA
jgi:hypothetical protein